MASSLISINNVSLFIPGDKKRTLVLKDITMNIAQGMHILLHGPNGSGKSSLLRLMHGDLWPDRGNIIWNYNGIAETSRIIARQMCSLVSPLIQENFQQHAWSVTVTDLLISGLKRNPPAFFADKENIPEPVIDILHEIDAYAWRQLPLYSLSQGQLRLALLGRAILQNPQILLLDEFTDGIDARHKSLIFNILKRLSAKITLVAASHRQNELSSLFSERYFLEGGRLFSEMPTCKPSCHFKKSVAPVPPDARALITLQNVNIFINRRKILKNINWQIKQGEHWRITGPNGSGKSTLLRVLAGDEFIACGGKMERLALDSQSRIENLAECRKAIHLISDLGQALYSYPLNALDFVCSGYDNCVGKYREYTIDEQKKAFDAICQFFPDDPNIPEVSIRRLSSGQLRCLLLARCMVAQPDFILMDEPFSGLDVNSRHFIIDILDKIALFNYKGWKPQIIFVSHYSDDCPQCINKEAKMENGHLVLQDLPV